MILEAFSQFLHNHPELPAGEALSIWLWERLENDPVDNVDQVIQMEIGIKKSGRAPVKGKIPVPQRAMDRLRDSGGKKLEEGSLIFRGTSTSGTQLLVSLYEFSMSYEQQRWSRFVHGLKASDFR